jgi:RimJ/RimL family protein N-acetyltransferase
MESRPVPEIITDRLVLRPPLAEDFEPWARFSSDPDVMRFIGGVQPRAIAWRGFLTMVGAWQIQGFAMFSVIERNSGQWIGRIGPWMPEGWPGPEVGWGLSAEHQGKGYALEAATASIDWAFDHLGWTEVIHSIDPANAPSQALAIRLGSTNRGPGTLPPPFDAARIEIWGQTRGEWRARRARPDR